MPDPTRNPETLRVGMPPSSKKRPVSDVQRKALRHWAHNQQRFPTQDSCRAWFYAEYGHRLSQPSVSDILSSRFCYLDSESNPSAFLRKGAGQWQDLENILYEWRESLTSKGEHVSGPMLIMKAREVWSSLPQYRNQPQPSFSTGWLHRFKQRYNIKQRRAEETSSAPEASESTYDATGLVPEEDGLAAEASVSAPEKVRSGIKAIRTIAGDYNEEDIYNMDETGLFWRMPPYTTQDLSSSNQPDMKYEKSPISIICCVNASGVDRLPIWMIGRTRMPRVLHNINMQTMGIRWRWNNTAWVDQMIMKDWLLFFYSHVGSRSVLLAMDNFPAHLAGLELAPPPPNVRICWLPKNPLTINQYQPLEQGILQSFKICYRKQWLWYILYCYERNLDPLQNVTLLDCVRWIIRAWNHYVLNTTIFACFLKSTLALHPMKPPIEFPNVSLLYEKVQQSAPGRVSDRLNIDDFLNPREESSRSSLYQHFISGGSSDNSSEEDDSTMPIPLPSSSEALNAVRILISYLEGQDALQASLLRPLERLERDLESSRHTAV